MVSYFYSDLKTKDQKILAKEYAVNNLNLASWLRCLTDLRNICAHSGRIYYRVFSSVPAGLNLKDAQKRRLWGLIIILNKLCPSPDYWNQEFLPELKKLIEEYGNVINLYHLAFPIDWYD